MMRLLDKPPATGSSEAASCGHVARRAGFETASALSSVVEQSLYEEAERLVRDGEKAAPLAARPPL